MSKKSHDHIVVVVRNGRWSSHGTGLRSLWLYSKLQRQGGIVENIKDGTYHYNVKRRGFRFATSMTKIED